MPTGDVSALFWTLIGLSGGAGVTAYSITGPKSRNLWIVCAALALAALLFRFGVPSWAATFAASTVPVLWALYPALTIGAVALIFRERRPGRAEDGDSPPPYNEKRPGLSNALVEVHRARESARDAVAHRRANLIPTISRMESALATVRKTFDLETPPRTGNGRADLMLWLDYFDDVWPFVQSGHYGEANDRAKSFIADRRTE